MIRQPSLFDLTPKPVKKTKTEQKEPMMPSDGDKRYCVYEHVFPNHKKYIGIACDYKRRWNHGRGYRFQEKMANAINHYGWDNIEHNIILDGINQDQACRLEKYLIAQLNTIEDGYNVSTGGEHNAHATYLDSYVLDMVRNAKQLNVTMRISFDDGEMDLPDFVSSIRFNKEKADFWNEAARAVEMKHRKYLPSDRLECHEFWFHMAQYFLLTIDIKSGKDVSSWQEPSIEQWRYDSIFGKE